MHMLPAVGELLPADWTQVLSVNERAALADAFTNMESKAAKLKAIEVSQAETPKAQNIIRAYIDAREHAEHTARTIASCVMHIVSAAFHMPRPHDPGVSPTHKHDLDNTCHHDIMQRIVSVQTIVGTTVPVTRRRIRRRKMVDVCSGQQSLAKYILPLDAGAEILSIDIIDKMQALADVPEHLHHRIHFVHLNQVL